MKRSKTIQLAFTAAFCALVYIGTWFFIPLPVGNINLGDGVILICAFSLGMGWSAGACAPGAALFDLSAGYAQYAPATALIKAFLPTVAILCFRLLSRTRLSPRVARAIAASLAETGMVAGYYLYEAVFLQLGWAGAAADIPFNLMQGAAAVLILSISERLIHWLSERIGTSMQ